MSSTFHRAHYNAIAKEIRELLKETLEFYNGGYEEAKERKNNKKKLYYATAALVTLALNLCKRFKEDNDRFDPVRFLDACSPNTDLYPLSELWED